MGYMYYYYYYYFCWNTIRWCQKIVTRITCLIGLIFVSKYFSRDLYSRVEKIDSNYINCHITWKVRYRFQTSDLSLETSNFKLWTSNWSWDDRFRIANYPARTLPLSQAKWLSFPEQFHIPINPKSPSLISLRMYWTHCSCNQNHLLLPCQTKHY